MYSNTRYYNISKKRPEMNLNTLGYTNEFQNLFDELNQENFCPGRVLAEHKERYVVKTGKGEFEAEITGNMRFAAKSREDFPAVGDWVGLALFEPDFALIHFILPRFSVLKRQAVGHSSQSQVIAANIDYAFIVQAVDRDFNMNRMERYLTICNTAKVKPVIVLSKTDLIEIQTLEHIKQEIGSRIKNVPVFAISNLTNEGFSHMNSFLKPEKTYCMLGSSGVGKSSFLNRLSGKSLMETGNISDSTGKGRHITTHRELIVLENGSLLIDNPGMREIGMTDVQSGLEITFDSIYTLAKSCKFKDCTHTSETGCKVLEAIQNGEIDEISYQNYLKMERERSHYETSVIEKRKKEKQFGKLMKNYKKDVKKNNLP